jgi:hypothetical protein
MAMSLNAVKKNCGTAVDIICENYTSKIYVLDFGVNKPFREYIRDAYEKWMVANPHGTKVKRQNGFPESS